MFLKANDVQLGQANPLSGKDTKKFIQSILLCFPTLTAETLSHKLGLASKSKIFKLKLPRKVVLYSLSLGGKDSRIRESNDELKKIATAVSNWGELQEDNERDVKIHLFFDMNGRGDLFPTLTTLWLLFNGSAGSEETSEMTMLPRYVVVHAPASKFIQNGADVMLAGFLRYKEDRQQNCFGIGHFQKGEKVCVIAAGNPFPFAIGRFALNSTEVRSKGFNGKGVVVTHCYGDHLWSVCGKLRPNEGFLDKEVKPIEARDAEGTGNPNEEHLPGPGNHFNQRGKGLQQAQQLNEDALLEQTFCHCLKKVKPTDFPLLANLFYSNYLLPSRPLDTQIDIKKTRYKKVATFLLHLETLKIVKLSENKEVLKLEAVFPENLCHLQENRVKWSKTEEVGNELEEKMKQLALEKEKRYRKVEVVDLYKPNKNIYSLPPSELQQLFPENSFNDCFTAQRCRELLFKYIAKTGLAVQENPKYMRLGMSSS